MNNPFSRKNENPPEQYGPFNNPDNPTLNPVVAEDEGKENKAWKGYLLNIDDIKSKIGKIKNKFKSESNTVNLDDLENTITENPKLWLDAAETLFTKKFNTKEQEPFPWTKETSKMQLLKNSVGAGILGGSAVVAKIAARSALLKGSRAALAYVSGGTGILIAGGAGAVAGGAWEGGKMIIKEKSRINSLESRLEELGKDYDAFHQDYQTQGPVDAIRKYVGMQGTLSRAEKTAVTDEDKAKVLEFKQKLEQLDLTTLLHKDKWENETDKNKRLYKFLRARSEQERDQLAADPKLRKILQNIEKREGSRDKVSIKKVAKAAGMGALIGGVTGLAGATIAEAVHSVVYGGSSVHEAATTLSSHAKEATKAVTESPTGSNIKETAKNLFADKKITLHKGDTLWGLVKQWNLDHGVPANKLTNKMIMEQVKHAALKNGIDVVAWKDALDGTGMPDIKIPVGHEIVLDKGLADIGDHFGLHIADHATEMAKETINNGHNIIQDSVNHAQSLPNDPFGFTTAEKVGLAAAGALLAGSLGIYLNKSKIQDYLNKKKNRYNSQSPTTNVSPAGQETTTPAEHEELKNLATEKQVPTNGVENFVNLLKDDGLLNQAENNNKLEVNDSQFIHDSLLAVDNYTTPSPEDLSCLVDSIKTIRKHTGLEDIESAILAINPDLKDQIISEVEGNTINNAPTPDNTQEKENDTEIEKLIEDWNEDKKDINLRIQDLENDFNDSDLSQLKGAIGNIFKSGEFYTSQRLPHYENPTPEEEKKVKQLELELEDQVKTWNTEISKIEQKTNIPSVPSWKEALSNEAKSLNITEQDGINHYISLMDEKEGPVIKALEIGALNKAEVDELRRYIKAQQDYSDNPADISNIDKAFELLITKESQAHGPGNSPANQKEYNAIGKVISVYKKLNPTLLNKHIEVLREEYMPEDQFVEYALNKWNKFPKIMKDEASKSAWIRLSKKRGILEEAVKEKVITDTQLTKIKTALELPAVDEAKLQVNILNPLKSIRQKITKRLGTSATNEQLELLNKLEEQLELACPELKTHNP